jgi:hypothetical protein
MGPESAVSANKTFLAEIPLVAYEVHRLWSISLLPLEGPG